MRSLALALLLACGACAPDAIYRGQTQGDACRMLLSTARDARDSLRTLTERIGDYKCAQWIAAFPPVTPEANDAQTRE